jgi:hypothetical protein
MYCFQHEQQATVATHHAWQAARAHHCLMRTPVPSAMEEHRNRGQSAFMAASYCCAVCRLLVASVQPRFKNTSSGLSGHQ